MDKQAYCIKSENINKFLTLAKQARRPFSEKQRTFINKFLNSANEFINSNIEAEKAHKIILVITTFQKRVESDILFLEDIKTLKRFKDSEGIETIKKIIRLERKYYDKIIDNISNEKDQNNDTHEQENLLNTIIYAQKLQKHLQNRLDYIEALKISNN